MALLTVHASMALRNDTGTSSIISSYRFLPAVQQDCSEGGIVFSSVHLWACACYCVCQHGDS